MAGSAHSSERVVAGRYRLDAPLGSGGMGTVWRAHDVVLGRDVAVKEVAFPPGLTAAEREVLVERTRREARAAARLDHRGAVTVYDVVEDGGAPYLVMEHVDAPTLADVVRRDGPLAPPVAAAVGLAVLDALRAAHARGIVHRDVKPSNVMLCAGTGGTPGRVVLTDFGIASSTGDPSITSTGLLLGSPAYTAPERARGEPPGPASDLWSLGATLFTAVEGRPPYDAGDALATVTAVQLGEPAPYVLAGPLEPVLAGLLERDPQRRLDAAGAVRLLSEAAAAPVAPPAGAAPPPEAVAPAEAVRTAAVPVRRAPAPARSRAPLAAAAALAGVLAVGGLGWALVADGGDDPGGSGAPQAAPAAPADEGTGSASEEPAAGAPATEGASGQPVAEPPAEQPAEEPADASGEPAGRPADAPGEPATTGPAAVPAGWTTHRDDEEGWSLPHPPGWEVGERNGLVQFRDPGTGWVLRVDHTDEPHPSALAAWQQASPAFAQRLRGYREERLEQVEYRGWDAADLEFTYDGGGTRLHVLDRTFIVGDEAYALYWQVPADEFAASRERFEQLAAAFSPDP